VSFVCQFVYMFSLYFYGEGCHSSVDEDSRDIMLCRLVWYVSTSPHGIFSLKANVSICIFMVIMNETIFHGSVQRDMPCVRNLINKIRKIIEWHGCVLSSFQLPCNTFDGCRSEQHSEDTKIV